MDEDFIKRTNLEGVLTIERPVFKDERGFFKEIYRKNELDRKISSSFQSVQANHSRSVKGILRGIHIAPWSKLVYCVRGIVQQVIVDLRRNSSTFGQYISLTLGEKDRKQVYIPPGCGNSFLILSKEADIIYLTDEYWQAGKEYGVAWNDPDLKIDWQIKQPILSEKDQRNQTLKELFPDRF